MVRTATVIIGGGTLGRRAVAAAATLPGAALIAADSGLDAALAAGLEPTALVGDLDSVSDAGRAWAAAHGVPTARFPADKDATDTELAIDHALGLGARRIVLIGGLGDRFDHLLGALVALGRPALAELDAIEFVLGDAVGHVLHPGAEVALEHPAGTTFSLLALHGRCTGVTVRGARWPLQAATLEPGSTLGISNQVAGGAWITTATGVLTVIIPAMAPEEGAR